ncbi:arginine-hydroxylase NDUFAF5, mitochondrial [Dermatophagoides pteronyssinus]|uniref:arginine-hydroxylase NDUFAF5, mitochondrial n=1 Tax=Dermatophagoides pteronyssinus TaxID=6956 RepID=UPI003F674B1F
MAENSKYKLKNIKMICDERLHGITIQYLKKLLDKTDTYTTIDDCLQDCQPFLSTDDYHRTIPESDQDSGFIDTIHIGKEDSNDIRYLFRRKVDQGQCAVYDLRDEEEYEIAFRVADRIFDIKRRFPFIVDLGTYKGLLGSHLTTETVDCILHCSSSFNSLKSIKQRDDIEIQKLFINEEDFILQENSADMIISSLDLHWINDLPQLFSNVFYSLKQDGVFIGSMFGGQTLFELRCSLQMAEIEREGGFGLHISPLITAQDIGSLLNRSGYTMLTIDTDEIIVHYPTIFELMYDLKGMGENNATILAKTHLNRDSLLII